MGDIGNTKFKISDLLDIFFAELDGESPRSKLQHEYGQTCGLKWPKNLGSRRRGWYCVMVQGGKNWQEMETAK